jgi:hypothetical protein
MLRKDLTGKRFGLLSVVSVSEVSRNGHYRYNVICDCGTEKTVLGTHLISEKTTSCGCKRRYPPRNWSGCGTVSMTYYNSVERCANGGKGRKSMEFDLDIEYVADLLDVKQNGICSLTGLDISISAKTASLDRIDSSKGYIRGNVQWLHKDINMMKRHYSTEYFKKLCGLVASHSSGNVCEVVDL